MAKSRGKETTEDLRLAKENHEYVLGMLGKLEKVSVFYRVEMEELGQRIDAAALEAFYGIRKKG